jgi:hypothetical protein
MEQTTKTCEREYYAMLCNGRLIMIAMPDKDIGTNREYGDECVLFFDFANYKMFNLIIVICYEYS